MKKLFTPFLFVGLLGGLMLLTGCPSDPCEDVECVNGNCVDGDCECDEGWTGENCDSLIQQPGVSGNLNIRVTKNNRNKPFNNYGCFAVLGKAEGDMAFLDYDYGRLPQFDKPKTYVNGYDELIQQTTIIDTFYSRKGSYEDTTTGEVSGAIQIRDVPVGVYYLHVFDGSRDKWVGAVSITEAEDDDDLLVSVEALGTVKIQVRQSSVAGTEIDSNYVAAYGPSSDSLRQALVPEPSDVPFDPILEGRTARVTNENGAPQGGVVYFYDVPVRELVFVAYNLNFAPETGDQASAYVKVRKNILTEALLAFQQ